MLAGRRHGADRGDEIEAAAVSPGRWRRTRRPAEGAHHALGIEPFGVDLRNERRKFARRQVAHGLDHIGAGGRMLLPA